eukprot:TRINITY_DN998_c0_g1_i3.p1 TRINITY_DN998_c0_g1~~TRINITY_DN998_c0_g1_i3.p1  ORF type:complete len:175 (+),score=21.47 TRINITY_DN998_c0_g1_i3:13-537(+)
MGSISNITNGLPARYSQPTNIKQDFDAEMSLPLTSIEKQYELPDGVMLTVGDERFRCPEALFRPSLVESEEDGIHQMVNKSILKCDTEFSDIFYSNIMVSGGNTKHGGIANRLSKEIVSLAPDSTQVNVVAPHHEYPAWTGGSMLSSLSSFASMCVSKQQFEEKGPRVASMKFF